MPMFAIFIILGTAAALKKIQRREFILILAIVLLWVLSFFINEESRVLMQMYYFRPVLVEGVCGIICISNFRNWEKFESVGKQFIVIGSALYFTTVILQILGKTEIQYMASAYNSLIFIIGAFWLAIQRKKTLFWIIAVVGAFIVLIAGNRGGLVCIAIFILLEFMFNKKIKIFSKVLFFLAIVLLLFNVDNILQSIEHVVERYDFESRTIEKFFEGTINEDSGRERYRLAAWEVSKDSPILGHGMGGSFKPLYEEVKGVTPSGMQHIYSHNLYFDFIMDYGIIFGTIIFFVLIVGLLRAISKSRKYKLVEILFLFFSIAIPKLMLSSNYLSEPTFFVFLGVLLNFNFVNYENDNQPAEVEI